MNKNTNNRRDVADYLAKLAKLQPNASDKKALEKQLQSTIEYISKLSEIDTSSVELTSQVTGLSNVFREDEIDEKRILTQEEALKNAKRKYKGFFVVNAIFED